MSGERFEAMVRQLGATHSRRAALRVFGGAVAGTAAMALFGSPKAHANDCPAGQTLCDTCVDLQTDPDNCGSCGQVCPHGGTGGNWVNPDGTISYDPTTYTGEICVDGGCTCPPYETYCPESVACVLLGADVNNCGTCGNACYASQVCENGRCVMPPPFRPVHPVPGQHPEEPPPQRPRY